MSSLCLPVISPLCLITFCAKLLALSPRPPMPPVTCTARSVPPVSASRGRRCVSLSWIPPVVLTSETTGKWEKVGKYVSIIPPGVHNGCGPKQSNPNWPPWKNNKTNSDCLLNLYDHIFKNRRIHPPTSEQVGGAGSKAFPFMWTAQRMSSGRARLTNKRLSYTAHSCLP